MTTNDPGAWRRVPAVLCQRQVGAAILLSLLMSFSGATLSQSTSPPRPVASSTPVGPRQILDLNLATVDQLRTLPGIGSAYAVRIVRGRPYSAKNQLVTKGILPEAAYDRIRDEIVAHRLPK